ncbi:proteinase-activated receptor 3-like [Hyperolius riggenbachi]|uniref:proteinase-activated receptor 3-like n=1 Tax=Hyperolius riggenbachi TaxID=752182 RepID=UPI0035A28B42
MRILLLLILLAGSVLSIRHKSRTPNNESVNLDIRTFRARFSSNDDIIPKEVIDGELGSEIENVQKHAPDNSSVLNNSSNKESTIPDKRTSRTKTRKVKDQSSKKVVRGEQSNSVNGTIAGNNSTNNGSDTLDIKTFRPLPRPRDDDDDDKLLQEVINGLVDGTTNNVNNTARNKRKPLLKNSTLAYLRSSTSTKMIPAIYIIVILIGIPSNILTLQMLFSRVRTVCTAIFYTNLAISDLLFCLTLPLKAAYHLDGNNWIFGEAMCRVLTVCFYGNMYGSILFLMCISISRYVAIVHPFIYRSLPKRTCTILLCSFVWIVVLMFMIPFYTKKQTYDIKELNLVLCNDMYEDSSDEFQFYYFISLAVFGYLIPFAVVAFCYFSIIKTLGTHDRKRFMYLKITVLLLFIFALCFTPSNIILIVHQVTYHYSYKDELYSSYLIALCFSSLNSCLDPFLYFLMSEITKPSKKYSKINKVSNDTHMKLLAS